MARHETNLVVRIILLAVLVSALHLTAQQKPVSDPTSSAATEQPFVIEYYYKVKWGHADEFLTLFKKNHLPLLRKEVELGRMLQVSAVTPRYHTTEDGRWDYRVTIVFKNATVANENFDEAALAKQLYPDQETYKAKSSVDSRSSTRTGTCPSNRST